MNTVSKEISKIFELQKSNKWKLKQSTAKERIQKLKKLQSAIDEHIEEIKEAIYRDLNKPDEEILLTEIYPVIKEIKYAVRNLRRWMRDVRVRSPLVFMGSKNSVRFEPKGLSLIISPWNFPFQLTVGPLVSAIAAGNCVILKPSEFSANTSRVISKLISKLFTEDEVAVCEGDYTVAQALLGQPFNHIFFTGSPGVGRIVMKDAIKNLASVTLELGGKSPVIIDRGADLEEAAKKIIWGKLVNCGQICTAPDYILVSEEDKKDLKNCLIKSTEKYYGDIKNIYNNRDYCRIINRKHYDRIKNLVDEAVEKGAKLEYGGIFRESDNFISPTILSDVPMGSEIMNEEIFGPIIPIITYRKLDEAIDIINSKPNPLALYIFGRKKKIVNKILMNTLAGDTVINDVVVHFANVNLPFGGFNNSGNCKIHGFYGFKAFSHERAIMRQSKYSILQLTYPPYTKFVKMLIDLSIKFF